MESNRGVDEGIEVMAKKVECWTESGGNVGCCWEGDFNAKIGRVRWGHEGEK